MLTDTTVKLSIKQTSNKNKFHERNSLVMMFINGRLWIVLLILVEETFTYNVNIKAGNFLAVQGEKFMYGGEHVSVWKLNQLLTCSN